MVVESKNGLPIWNWLDPAVTGNSPSAAATNMVDMVPASLSIVGRKPLGESLYTWVFTGGVNSPPELGASPVEPVAMYRFQVVPV